mgnify:CR=1 FL=1
MTGIRQATNSAYRIIALAAVSIFILYFGIKYIKSKIVEKRVETENAIIFDKLRATSKLVIWEQDFRMNKVTTAQKKYFGSDLLKFTEKLSTSAQGKIGFHIDLADTVNTQFVVTPKYIEIHSPLKLTYVSIDNSTIKQIKEASIDPSLEIDKEQAIKELNEAALREYLNPALTKARNESLAKQEKTLQAIAGKPVKIVITGEPTLEESLQWIRKKD